MMGFDSATSSFRALLVNKSYTKKLIKAKLKINLQLLSKKKSKPFFVSKVLSSNPSPRPKKLCRSKMVVKLRKAKKIMKHS